MRQVEQHANPDVEKILIATKCDLKAERAVSTEEGEEMAREFGIPFFETSSLDGTNVQETFYEIAKKIKDT